MSVAGVVVRDVDAGMVYADGVYNGLALAVRLILGQEGARVPDSLRAAVFAWQCHVIHREWLAGQGRPVSYVQAAEALSFMHAVIRQTGLEMPTHVD